MFNGDKKLPTIGPTVPVSRKRGLELVYVIGRFLLLLFYCLLLLPLFVVVLCLVLLCYSVICLLVLQLFSVEGKRGLLLYVNFLPDVLRQSVFFGSSSRRSPAVEVQKHLSNISILS